MSTNNPPLTKSEDVGAEIEHILREYLAWYPFELLHSTDPEVQVKAQENTKSQILQLVEEQRERAFAGGFGAGGGEVYSLELAWKLYNEALKGKELINES